ncbi:trypsin-like serine peptidase [Streptosporangium roseum]|uniref:trypsin-like serine peptidase n=1 Tax=Streptosporangium roseum TaxID=2001 RepID=UPI00332BAD5A
MTPEAFPHYQTDTEPGSSGSPVFNDQWEIVALHHAGVPAPDHDAFGGVINEGVRVSRLLAFLRDRPFPPAQQALLDRLFTERISLPPTPPALPASTAPADRPLTRPAEPAEQLAPVEPVGRSAGQVPLTLTLTVPFDIRLRGEPADAAGPAAAATEAIRTTPAAAATTRTSCRAAIGCRCPPCPPISSRWRPSTGTPATGRRAMGRRTC